MYYHKYKAKQEYTMIWTSSELDIQVNNSNFDLGQNYFLPNLELVWPNSELVWPRSKSLIIYHC